MTLDDICKRAIHKTYFWCTICGIDYNTAIDLAWSKESDLTRKMIKDRLKIVR